MTKCAEIREHCVPTQIQQPFCLVTSNNPLFEASRGQKCGIIINKMGKCGEF